MQQYHSTTLLPKIIKYPRTSVIALIVTETGNLNVLL